MKKYDPVAGKYYEDNSPLGIGNSPYNRAAYENMNRKPTPTQTPKKPSSSSSSYRSSSYSSRPSTSSYRPSSSSYCPNTHTTYNDGGGSFFLGFILGLVIPILNLILFIVFRKKEILRRTGNGFLTAFIVEVAFFFSGGFYLVYDWLAKMFGWGPLF